MGTHTRTHAHTHFGLTKVIQETRREPACSQRAWFKNVLLAIVMKQVLISALPSKNQVLCEYCTHDKCKLKSHEKGLFTKEHLLIVNYDFWDVHTHAFPRESDF